MTLRGANAPHGPYAITDGRRRRTIVAAVDVTLLCAGTALALWLLTLPMCEPTPCQAAQQAGRRVLCTMICRSSLLYAYRVQLLIVGAVMVLGGLGLAHRWMAGDVGAKA